MDRLAELSALVAILDTGSLIGAARQLKRSPPTMTRLLAAIEQRAGTRLVERTSRRLRATDAGARLAAQARPLLEGYASAMSGMLPAEVRGSLRVTAPLVFGRRHVTPVVSSFLDAFPAVSVDLVLDDRPLDLIAEGIEVAVRIGKLPASGLVARGVGHVRRVLVASPDYLARRGQPKSPADLAGHDSIFTASQPRPLVWRLWSAGRARPVRLRPRLVVNEVDAMLIAVRSGRGIGSALSYQVEDDLAAHSLVRLLPAFEPPPLPVNLLMPGGQRAPPRVRAFFDHSVRALQALPVLQRERS